MHKFVGDRKALTNKWVIIICKCTLTLYSSIWWQKAANNAHTCKRRAHDAANIVTPFSSHICINIMYGLRMPYMCTSFGTNGDSFDKFFVFLWIFQCVVSSWCRDQEKALLTLHVVTEGVGIPGSQDPSSTFLGKIFLSSVTITGTNPLHEIRYESKIYRHLLIDQIILASS